MSGYTTIEDKGVKLLSGFLAPSEQKHYFLKNIHMRYSQPLFLVHTIYVLYTKLKMYCV